MGNLIAKVVVRYINCRNAAMGNLKQLFQNSFLDSLVMLLDCDNGIFQIKGIEALLLVCNVCMQTLTLQQLSFPFFCCII